MANMCRRDSSSKNAADRKERIRSRGQRARTDAMGASSADEYEEVQSTETEYDRRLRMFA